MMRVRWCAAVTVLVTCLLVGNAEAASSWTIDHAPSPYILGPPALYGVSCWDDQDCMAVGGTGLNLAYFVAGVALAEQRTPNGWRLLPVPTANENGTSLASVSCPAAGECMAVGTVDYNTGVPAPLFEQFSGGAWHRLPAPQGAGSELMYGVSCPTTKWCMAVSSGSDTFTFDGASWSLAPALPSQFNADGVSCSSPSACEAAGWTFTAGGLGITPMAAYWDGSAWHAQSTPNLPYDSSAFESVDCLSSSFCAAVGGKQQADFYGPPHALAETWSAAGWTVDPAPGTDGDFLWGVSCGSASSCQAVGQTYGGSLIEYRSGGKWRSEPNPGSENGSQLFAISCPDTTGCVAVGDGPPEGVFVERYGTAGARAARAAAKVHPRRRWSRARAGHPPR